MEESTMAKESGAFRERSDVSAGVIRIVRDVKRLRSRPLKGRCLRALVRCFEIDGAEIWVELVRVAGRGMRPGVRRMRTPLLGILGKLLLHGSLDRLVGLKVRLWL